MKPRYYARVDLDKGNYCGLVKLEAGEAFSLDRDGMKWEKNNYLYGVAEDTTHYDPVSEQEAADMMKGWEKG